MKKLLFLLDLGFDREVPEIKQSLYLIDNLTDNR